MDRLFWGCSMIDVLSRIAKTVQENDLAFKCLRKMFIFFRIFSEIYINVHKIH